MAAMLDFGVLCELSDVAELGRRPFLDEWTGERFSGLDLDRSGAERLAFDGDAYCLDEALLLDSDRERYGLSRVLLDSDRVRLGLARMCGFRLLLLGLVGLLLTTFIRSLVPRDMLFWNCS